MDQDKHYVDRKFGHCSIEWKLRNFCTFWHDGKERVVVSSPEFYIRSFPSTKWKMMLKISSINRKTESTRRISFELKRLKCNENSQLVSADCKFQFFRDEEEKGTKYFKHDFLPNSFYETDEFIFLQAILQSCLPSEDMSSFKTSSLSFVLTMLIHFPDQKETFYGCTDSALKNLSEDLLSLFGSGEHADIHLKVGEKYLNVHKPILCSRIKDEDVKDLIARPKECVSNFNYSACENFFRFLYSANMDYAVKEPSLSIYEAALDYDIKPIVEYYDPDTLHLYSKKDTELYILSWTISNFFERTESILTSPLMAIVETDIKCRLKIYPRDVGFHYEFTSLLVDIEAANKDLDICVEFFVDTPDRWNVIFQIHRRIAGNETFRKKQAVSRYDLGRHLRNGSITFGFILRIDTGTESSVVGVSTYRCLQFSEQLNYKYLSYNILSLYDNQMYTDEAPAANSGLKTKFHKCILSARCMNGLHEAILEGFSDNTEVIESVAFEHLLYFLYSGRLNTRAMSLKASFVLYAVAEKFYMGTLKHVIIDHLLKILDTQNAEDIYEFAESKNIVNLRNSALTLSEHVAKRKLL